MVTIFVDTNLNGDSVTLEIRGEKIGRITGKTTNEVALKLLGYLTLEDTAYLVKGIGIDSETGGKCVIYEAQYGDHELFVRPYAMFAEELDKERYPDATQKFRFELVFPDFIKDMEERKRDNQAKSR